MPLAVGGRYRWANDVRDKVLARLLAMNAQCAEEERLAARTIKPAQPAPVKRRGRKPKPDLSERLL